MNHPFVESGIAAAQYRARACREALERAISAKSERAVWEAIGYAFGQATETEARLNETMRLIEEIKATEEKEEAAE